MQSDGDGAIGARRRPTAVTGSREPAPPFPKASSPEYEKSTSSVVKAIDSSRVLLAVGRAMNGVLAQALGVKIVRASASGIPLDDAWFRHLSYFNHLFDLVKDVDGDVVECGVAWGRTLAMLASLERAQGGKRHVWGFDSWGGLPNPEPEDLPASRFGPFERSDIHAVRNTLKNHGFNDAEIATSITLVQGRFADTVGDYDGEDIALLHLDVVLHRSYRDCLMALWPRVPVGGVVAVDDYAVEPVLHPGANKAVDDFVAAHRSETALQRDSVADRYYIVKLA